LRIADTKSRDGFRNSDVGPFGGASARDQKSAVKMSEGEEY